MVMSATVHIFSWGERGNVLFKEAFWIEHFIFHIMKISVLLHQWKTFIICFTWYLKFFFCHFQSLVNLSNIWKCQFIFDQAVSSQRSLQCFNERCTVLFHSTIERWRHTCSMVYLFYIVSPCTIQSNDKMLHNIIKHLVA